MIHAGTLLLILLFAPPLAAQVPLAVLAGLLLIVAYNMGEWHQIPSLLKMTKAHIAVWIATFADSNGRSDSCGEGGNGRIRIAGAGRSRGSGARQQPAHLMERADFHAHLGDANILRNVHEALERARELAKELDLDRGIKRSGEILTRENR